MEDQRDNSEVTIEFGRHKGTRIQRMPISYLQWMVNSNAMQADDARFELGRRQVVYPDIEITGHAINRASQKVLDIWERDRRVHKHDSNFEGLHSWLLRIGHEALAKEPDGERIHHKGMILAFAFGSVYPTLTTVMRKDKA